MTVCLLYHGVGATPSGGHRSLDVPFERFDRQMRHVKLSGDIAITFDDAYAALEDHALPLLIDLGLTALVFVVTGSVGSRSDWTGEAQSRPIMSAGALRAFRARGIRFGAHSRTHADLTRLDDAAALREIAGSKAELADILGEDVEAFAYPYGAYDQRIRDLAARHFARAYTTREGRNAPGADPLTLRRSMVQPFNPDLDFRLQCRLGFSPLEALRRWRRGFSHG